MLLLTLDSDKLDKTSLIHRTFNMGNDASEIDMMTLAQQVQAVVQRVCLYLPPPHILCLFYLRVRVGRERW